MHSRAKREKRYVSTETRFNFNIEYCIERIGNNVSYTKSNLSKVNLHVFYICYIGYITRLNCLFYSLCKIEILKYDHAFFIRKTRDRVCIEKYIELSEIIISISFSGTMCTIFYRPKVGTWASRGRSHPEIHRQISGCGQSRDVDVPTSGQSKVIHGAWSEL